MTQRIAADLNRDVAYETPGSVNMPDKTLGLFARTGGIVWITFQLFFAIFVMEAVAEGAGFTVITPRLSSAWSGTVSLVVSVNQPALSKSQSYKIAVDGQLLAWPSAIPTTAPYTYQLHTTSLVNGPHSIFIQALWWTPSGGYTEYGEWGPVTFTTSNGHVPLGVLANYREIFLKPGDTFKLSGTTSYTDGKRAGVSTTFAITASQPAAKVATVAADGTVTARALGEATVRLTARNGMTRDVRVVVNDQNITPHFGKDGSILAQYDPSKSLFVRSMFFLDHHAINSDPAYSPALAAAAVNTFEDGIYFAPNASTPDITSYENYVNQNLFGPIQSTAQANNMYVLYTGEGMTRGSDVLYNASRGPGVTWSPTPIAYSFTKARDIGRFIGVEMGDELNSAWGNAPAINGNMGQGPQQIACINNLCTVTWRNWNINATSKFIITGSADPNLNRPVSNPYVLRQNIDPYQFSFIAANVGTKTYTTATAPNLVMEMWACCAEGVGGSDYVHNDAIQVVMSQIHRVSGGPKITFNISGNAYYVLVQNWLGDPNFSDYDDVYGLSVSASYPWGPGLGELLNSEAQTVLAKFPYIQKDKPLFLLAGATGNEYTIGGTSVPVASLNSDTISFSQPHGIINFVPYLDRLEVSGNSNSPSNVRYRVFSVPDGNTLKVYYQHPVTVGSANGVNLNFQDGSHGIGNMVVQADGNAYAYINAGSSCPAVGFHAGQTVTISGSSVPGFNKAWDVVAGGASSVPNCQAIHLGEIPTGTGSGGRAQIVTSNFPAPLPTDFTNLNTAAQIMWDAEEGASGVRVYGFQPDENKDSYYGSLYAGEPLVDPGSDTLQALTNPIYDGPASVARWQAMSNAFNLIKDLEPYLLQPKLNSPDYGPLVNTAARTSSHGQVLLMTNFSQTSVAETVDLSTYNPSGGPGTIYRMSAISLTHAPISGTSAQVTFAPGETIAFTFQAASSARKEITARP